jgi:hypothetical protein
MALAGKIFAFIRIAGCACSATVLNTKHAEIVVGQALAALVLDKPCADVAPEKGAWLASVARGFLPRPGLGATLPRNLSNEWRLSGHKRL